MKTRCHNQPEFNLPPMRRANERWVCDRLISVIIAIWIFDCLRRSAATEMINDFCDCKMCNATSSCATCSRTCVCSKMSLPTSRYGKYCGVYYTGCAGEASCDPLDYCCMYHDACVGCPATCGDGYTSCHCNVGLIDCIVNMTAVGHGSNLLALVQEMHIQAKNIGVDHYISSSCADSSGEESEDAAIDDGMHVPRITANDECPYQVTAAANIVQDMCDILLYAPSGKGGCTKGETPPVCFAMQKRGLIPLRNRSDGGNWSTRRT